MAGVEISKDPITPKSTGAAAFDPGPVTTHQSADNASSGAAAFEPIGTSVLRGFTAQAEPIETKVIEAPTKPPAKSKPPAETK